MPSIFTLSGSGEPGLGRKPKPKREPIPVGSCACRENPRTGRGVQVCNIGKGALTPNGKTTRSGYLIKGSCTPTKKTEK